MIPVTHPTFTNPFNGFGDCKVSYLSSVSGLVAWTDYIPVITVVASTSIEGRTEANGYQNVHPVGATGNVAWTDYIPVYEDATKTVPWSTDANGYIPVGMSEDGVLGFLSQADFLAELEYTAVPDVSNGETPTFTRATTETGQKWDEAGYLDFTALAGEIVFKGARRERNLFTTSSENFSSGWTTTNSIVVTTSGGGLPVSGGYAEFASDVGSPRLQQVASPLVVGNVYVWSFYVLMSDNSEPNTATAGNYRDFTLVVNGGDISNYSAITNTDVGDSVWCVSYKFTATITTLPILHKYAGLSTATALRVSGMQINDITGETDQTTIRPYVSVGVESAPAYHGSMVDGVKCYDTDRSGNPISTSGSYPLIGYVPWEARTNLCLQSNAFTTTWANSGAAPTQNAIGPDGATSAWTLTDSSAVATAYITQAITLTAAAHTVSLKVKKTTGAQSSYPVILALTGAGSILSGVTVDTSNGVATPWTSFTGYTIASGVSVRCASHSASFWQVEMTFTATADSWSFYLEPAGALTPTLATVGTEVSAQGSAVFYGAQVEPGSFATPNIPTTTVAVARNADVLTYTGADVALLKTLMAGFRREVGVSTSGVAVSIDDGGLSERAHVGLSNATNVQFFCRAGGVDQWNTQSNTYAPGTDAKVAWAQETNLVKFGKDGTALTEDTVATMPNTNKLGIGHIATYDVFNGNVGPVVAWTRPLSQSEIAAVTS